MRSLSTCVITKSDAVFTYRVIKKGMVYSPRKIMRASNHTPSYHYLSSLFLLSLTSSCCITNYIEVIYWTVNNTEYDIVALGSKCTNQPTLLRSLIHNRGVMWTTWLRWNYCSVTRVYCTRRRTEASWKRRLEWSHLGSTALVSLFIVFFFSRGVFVCSCLSVASTR